MAKIHVPTVLRSMLWVTVSISEKAKTARLPEWSGAIASVAVVRSPRSNRQLGEREKLVIGDQGQRRSPDGEANAF